MERTSRARLCLDLYLTFARIGFLTFGGGIAMLPMLQREIVENKGWATEETLVDYYAIGQCTPGVIAVNTATFVGRSVGGFWGSITATLGIITPSLIIITLIAAILENFAELSVVKNAFAGVRACVCVLILNAVVKLWKKSVVDVWSFLLFLTVLLCCVFLDVSPVIFVLLSAVLGILIKSMEAKQK